MKGSRERPGSEGGTDGSRYLDDDGNPVLACHGVYLPPADFSSGTLEPPVSRYETEVSHEIDKHHLEEKTFWSKDHDKDKWWYRANGGFRM